MSMIVEQQLTAGAPQRRLSAEWLNWKLVTGAGAVLAILLLGIAGSAFWDLSLAHPGAAPVNLPPVWAGGQADHPFGTDNSGRDMAALLVAGAPATLRIGVIVGLVAVALGTALGFCAGYLGGWVDDVIRTASDVTLTIPQLAILVVVASYVEDMSANVMAVVVALFAWAGPTRLIRAQVLTLRDRGYVRMARLSAVSTPGIMFKEITPNLLPYLASSFVSAASAGIWVAVGLEALGLGPQREPTLGTTIYWAIRSSAVLRGLWWWWAEPILILVVIFVGLFLCTIALDEIANPRLRGARR